MTGALARPRWPWVPIALGTYAALLAVLPDPARLALVAPLALIALTWWILIGPPDRWLLTFLCAAALLPPLPIALGDSGPHPSLILAALGVLVGLIRLREWRVPVTGLARSMIVLFFVLLVSLAPAALYSGLPVAFGSLARVLLFGISVYVFFYVTSGPEDSVRAFRSAQILFAAGALAALFACVDFYYQFPAPAGFGPQFVWLDSGGVFRRAQGLFYEASTLGNFCAFFLVMVAVALTWPGKRPPLSRPLLLIGTAILSAALVLSFSRASLINVFVALAALIWLRRRQLGFRRIGIGLLLAVAVGSVATHYFLPAFTELYWNRLSNAAYLFSATEGVLSGRLSSWQMLADFLRENPFYALFGIGYKTLPYSTFIGQAVVGDNMYLTMLVETGILGLTSFLAVNFSILSVSYRAAATTSLRGSFFGTWVFCFWMGQMAQMLSGDLFTYWRVLPFYFWALAVAVRSADEHSLPRSVQ